MITIKRNPKIDLEEIKVVVSGDGGLTKTQAIGSIDIGLQPYMMINNVPIPETYIDSFYLSSEHFIPILKVYFKDSFQLLRNEQIPYDNDIISVYINTGTRDESLAPVLRDIRMDFKIVEFNYIKSEELFYIEGLPNIDDLYKQSHFSFPSTTSYNCLEQLSNIMKVGFATNIDKTKDNMTWINPGLETYDFIQDVTWKSYIDDSSFTVSFIDYYYNLNFVNVEKQLKEDIQNQKGLINVNPGEPGFNESKQVIIDDLILVNQPELFTNTVFEDYEILNDSTRTSLRNGYKVDLYYYDKTAFWQNKAGGFLRFQLETSTDDGITLKSTPNDTKSDGFFKTNKKKVYITDLDVDNTHKNYNYSALLNRYNQDEIEKLKIKLTMRSPNYNIYKYQKIRVDIFDNDNNRQQLYNIRLSGEWLVLEINYFYTPETGLKQELILAKRSYTSDDSPYNSPFLTEEN